MCVRLFVAMRAAGESLVRYAVNLHFKLALPASSIIFALLAIPLGLLEIGRASCRERV